MKRIFLIALILCLTTQLFSQSSAPLFTEAELKQIHKQQIRLIICDSLNQQLTVKHDILNSQLAIKDAQFKLLKRNNELTEIENNALLKEVEGQDAHIKKLNRKLRLLKLGYIGVGVAAVLVTARLLIK